MSTNPGRILGPADFTAPSVVLNQPADERLDYMPEQSLGTILESALERQNNALKPHHEIRREAIEQVSIFKLICKRWRIIRLLKWMSNKIDDLSEKLYDIALNLEP